MPGFSRSAEGGVQDAWVPHLLWSWLKRRLLTPRSWAMTVLGCRKAGGLQGRGREVRVSVARQSSPISPQSPNAPLPAPWSPLVPPQSHNAPPSPTPCPLTPSVNPIISHPLALQSPSIPQGPTPPHLPQYPTPYLPGTPSIPVPPSLPSLPPRTPKTSGPECPVQLPLPSLFYPAGSS